MVAWATQFTTAEGSKILSPSGAAEASAARAGAGKLLEVLAVKSLLCFLINARTNKLILLLVMCGSGSCLMCGTGLNLDNVEGLLTLRGIAIVVMKALHFIETSMFLDVTTGTESDVEDEETNETAIREAEKKKTAEDNMDLD